MEINAPDAIYNILDFGAKGDGKTDDTPAIQKALDECQKSNGGTVYVPNQYMCEYLSIH